MKELNAAVESLQQRVCPSLALRSDLAFTQCRAIAATGPKSLSLFADAVQLFQRGSSHTSSAALWCRSPTGKPAWEWIVRPGTAGFRDHRVRGGWRRRMGPPRIAPEADRPPAASGVASARAAHVQRARGREMRARGNAQSGDRDDTARLGANGGAATDTHPRALGVRSRGSFPH